MGSGASCKGGVCFKNDPHDITNSCKAQSDWDSCKDLHDGVKAAVSGIATFVFGISAAFLFTAGSLNTAGGVYCHKAKVAINLGGHPARSYTTGDTLPAPPTPRAPVARVASASRR